MIHWNKGRVEKILEERQGYQRVWIKEETGKESPAIHYPFLMGKVQEGDEVWLNTTAVDLELGTGGHHFIAGWVDQAPASQSLRGHIMKLRYTPFQVAVLGGEEPSSPYHARIKEMASLQGTPVLIGELHSMLPVVAAWWHHKAQDCQQAPRVIYVMTDGGALPIHLSQHIAVLREQEWLSGTVTAGHAFGGDVEAVNIYSALLLARWALQGDLIFVSMGPGIVGTGTPYGFSGVEQGQIINAVHSLGGIPVAIPRIHSGDGRKRHQGISHHTQRNLGHIALVSAIVPFPVQSGELTALLEQQKREITQPHHWVAAHVGKESITRALQKYPLKVTTMGRSVEEDALFFITVAGAADITWNLWQDITDGFSVDEAIARVK
ncbi:hypothetical protein GCM10011571_09970 [Marinithermofilum abyssi]|uniref:DUF3866 family protein n=1 Tax=Marinithermofilum abyssi TaxID=1571185 RepID=A0A8J2VEI7_9BACL|nr:DUF3866 family protein [Marinithermofilum abyssi]GGE10670.1 hypothetical protein GCM10011571_09970 [Marinithermofilum abyssi]